MTVKSEFGLRDFEAMIEAYGADRTRWPAGRRAVAEALLSTSVDARRLIVEAEALDRLLSHAALPANGAVLPSQFLDRVMAAATSAPGAADLARPTTREAAVVALPRPVTVAPPRAARPPLRRQVGGSWRAAAVLAMALMTGVAMGSLDIFSGPIGGLAEIIGVEMEGEHAVASLHLDSLPVIVDEDHL